MLHIPSNRFWILILIITTLVVGSCRRDSGNNNDNNISNNDSLGGVIPDIPLEILDNEYTAILNKMCNNQEFSDLKYNTQNTNFYPLNKDTTSLFLSVSEVDCGYTPGSCGRNIELIRNENNQYESLYKACGKIITIDTDIDGYKMKMRYSTTSEREIEVTYDGKNIKANTISYFGMPVLDLKEISNEENILINNLIRKGKKTENLDAIMIDFQEKTYPDGLTINTYNYDIDSISKYYIFLRKGNRLLQKIDGEGKINVKDDTNSILITNKEISKKYTINTTQKKLVEVK